MKRARLGLWLLALAMGCGDPADGAGCNPKPSSQKKTKPAGCGFGFQTETPDTEGPGTDGKHRRYTFFGAPTAADPKGEAIHPTVKNGQQTFSWRSMPSGDTAQLRVSPAGFGVITPLTGTNRAQLTALTTALVDLDLYDATDAYVDTLSHRIVDNANASFGLRHVSTRPLALLADRPLSFSLVLSTVVDRDVVDEQVVVTASGGTAKRQAAWYAWRVTLDEGVGAVQLAATSSSGVTSDPLHLAVVPQITALETTRDDLLATGVFPENEPVELCPFASFAAWEVTGVGAIELAVDGGLFAVERDDGCYALYPSEAGPARLTLSFEELVREYYVFVGDADMSAPDLAGNDGGT